MPAQFSEAVALFVKMLFIWSGKCRGASCQRTAYSEMRIRIMSRSLLGVKTALQYLNPKHKTCLVEENSAVPSPFKTTAIPVYTPIGIVYSLFQQKSMTHVVSLVCDLYPGDRHTSNKEVV